MQNIDDSIRFVAQSMNDFAKTLPDSASEAFRALGAQHFSILVNAARAGGTPQPDTTPSPGEEAVSQG